ncbi:MAG: RecB family exonuclease [Caldisericum sp.]
MSYYNKNDTIELSFQKINTYSQCGLKYYFKYVEKIPTPSTSYVVLGKAFHKALENYFLEKMKKGENPEVDLLLSTYVDEIDFVASNEEIYLSDDEKTKGKDKIIDEIKNLGTFGLRIYHKERAQVIEPLFVEERFEMDLGEASRLVGLENEGFSKVKIIGVVDLVNADGTIIDYKTKRGSKGEEADKSQQLTIYALWFKSLYGELPPKCELDNIILSAKMPKIITTSTQKTEEDIKRLLRRISRIADGIRKEVYIPPDQSSWVCSYCMYKILGICKEYPV